MSAIDVDSDAVEPWWQAAARRRHKHLLIGVMVTVALVEVPVFALLHQLHPATSAVHHHRAPWWVIMALVAGLVAFLVGYVLVISRLQRRGVRWVQPQPIMALGWKSRRRIVKALRRGVPLDDENSPEGEIAVLTAHRLRRRRTAVLLLAVTLFLIADFSFLIVRERSARWLWVGEACLLVVALGIQWRLRRGAGRYLASSTRPDAHDPAPTAR